MNEVLNDGLDRDKPIAITYDPTFDGFYQFAGLTNTNVAIVKLSAVNEKSVISELRKSDDTYLDRDVYFETTVENIRNVVNIHEVGGHGSGISPRDPDHYQCYDLQFKNPQWSRTTANFKATMLYVGKLLYGYAGKNILNSPHANKYLYQGGRKEEIKNKKWSTGK
ncbi:MAG: hypothetical protein P1P88_15030 [Bacteroidales bacterium]|nr:hypothetical protein [Bacteroidales bacterium]